MKHIALESRRYHSQRVTSARVKSNQHAANTHTHTPSVTLPVNEVAWERGQRATNNDQELFICNGGKLMYFATRTE